MSAGGSFFGGLVGGFGKTMLHNKDLAHEKEMQDTQNRIRVLEAASRDPNLDDAAREHVIQELIAIGEGKPGKPPKGQLPVPMGQIHDTIKQIDAAHPSPVAPPPPPGSSINLPPGMDPKGQYTPGYVPQNTTPPAYPGGQVPPSASAGVSAPPAPPQQRYTLTHAQMQQRVIDDAVAVEHAKFTAKEQDLNTSVSNILQTMKDNKIEVTPERKQRIIEQVHNIKISSGAPRFGRDQIPAEDIPDNAIDATTGNPLVKIPGQMYREVWNGDGTFKGHTTAGKPKLNSVQQKFQAKVDDAVSSNKPQDGESPDDFRKRMEVSVHKQQYDTDSKKLIGLGLGNQAKAVNIQRVQQEIAQGGAIPFRSAKILWDGAYRAAGMRQRSMDPADFGKGVDEMADEELQKVGTSRSEVAIALRNQQGTLTPDKNSGKKKNKTAPPSAVDPNNPAGLDLKP